jgi:predicted PurR-regulated permease PerM
MTELTPPRHDWTARRVRASGSSILLTIVAIVAVYLLSGLFVAASQPLGWVAAAACIALVLSPAVQLLGRRLPRTLAILAVYAAVLALVATLGVGLYVEIDAQLSELGETLPAAAQELEDADDDGVLSQLGFGSLVQGVVDDVTDRVLPEADVDAVSSVPAFFITGILSIFLMIWSRRLFDAALRQISEPTRRDRASHIASTSLRLAQTYVWGALVVAVVVGVAGGGLARAIGLPTPLVLGVVLGMASLVPSIGVLFGGVPMLIMTAAFEPATTTVLVAAAVIALQLGANQVARTAIEPRSMRVGPAVLVIVVLVGSDLYGIGGALVGAVAAIVAVAVIEARGSSGVDDQRPVSLPDSDGEPKTSVLK